QETAADAHQFGIEIRDLQAVIESFGAKVYDALQKKLGFSVESLTKWLQTNGPWLANRMVEGMSKIWAVATKIVSVIRERRGARGAAGLMGPCDTRVEHHAPCKFCNPEALRRNGDFGRPPESYGRFCEARGRYIGWRP